jgi:hypothetical protein
VVPALTQHLDAVKDLTGGSLAVAVVRAPVPAATASNTLSWDASSADFTTAAADVALDDTVLAASLLDVYRGRTDAVLVDPLSALIGFRHLGLVAVAVEAPAPVTHAYARVADKDLRRLLTSASATSAQAFLTAGGYTHTSVAPAAPALAYAASVHYVALYRTLEQDQDQLPGVFSASSLPSAAALAARRVCLPSLHTASWLSATLPAASALTTDGGYATCSGSLQQYTRAAFPAACAPPLEEGGAGVCDLCFSEPSASTTGLSSTSNGTAVASASTTTPVAGCSRLNRYAGEAGALRGVAERACEVAFVRNDTLARLCDRTVTDRYVGGTSTGYSAGAASDTAPDWCGWLGNVAQVPLSAYQAASATAASARGAVLMVRSSSLADEGSEALAGFTGLANRRADVLAGVGEGVRGLAGCQNCLSSEWTQSVVQQTEEVLAGSAGYQAFSNCYSGDSVDVFSCLTGMDTQCVAVEANAASWVAPALGAIAAVLVAGLAL